MKDIKEIIQSTLSKTENTEVFYSNQKELNIGCLNREINEYKISEFEGFSARVTNKGRQGTAFSEKTDSASLEEIVHKAGQSLEFMEEDQGNRLYDGKDSCFIEQYYSSKMPDPQKEMDFTLAIEEGAKKVDSRIVNVPVTKYGRIDEIIGVANSKGMMKTERFSLFYAYTYLMAENGQDTQTGYYSKAAYDFNSLNPGEIARKAAASALNLLDAQEISSGSFPVILDNITASALIGQMTGPYSAENIQKGRSMLENKLNTQIASSIVSIIDDPLSGNLGSRSFDDEGVPVSRYPVIEEGVFKGVLYNQYSASREGVRSTGHGRRGSFRNSLGTGLHCPYIPNGGLSEDSLINGVDKGLYITEIEGLHSGLNGITGDFSLGAKGFMILGGKKAFPVKNITIAGNFFTMLMDIEALADNRRTDSNRSLSAPSILIKTMAVSGK